MIAHTRRNSFGSTASSLSSSSTYPSSAATPPSSSSNLSGGGSPERRAGKLESPDALVRDLTTSEIEALLAKRLATEKRTPGTSAPAPPAYPYPDFFLPSTKPRKPKAASTSSTGKKKMFGLFGGSKASLVSSSTTASPAPSIATFPSSSIKSTSVPSFAEFAKATTRRVRAIVRGKLNSRTPVSELPKTWEEYGDRYARNGIDLEDAPLPPMRSELEGVSRSPLPPTPFDNRLWAAPTPSNELTRQAFVRELDLFGTRNPTPSLASSSSPSPTSLEDHPAFVKIVQKCRELFNTKVGMLTVLDDETQLFLATGGMPDGVASLPRSVTFCSHAILNEDRGLVVLDSLKDWRFANGVPTQDMGARFYAGVPLLAPTFGNLNAPAVALGTLCVVDDRPRGAFTKEEREMLFELAAEASREVEGWVYSRMSSKLARLEELYQADRLTESDSKPFSRLQISAPSAPSPPASPQAPPRPRRPSTNPPRSPVPTEDLPPTPPKSSSYRQDSGSDHFTGQSTTSVPPPPDADWSSLFTESQPDHNLRAVPDPPLFSIQPNILDAFDSATRLLSDTLSLSLVYLAALDLSSPSHTLSLLSSFGLPSPAPTFDAALHFKALRAPEGGILFQRTESGRGFSSGLLVPVGESKGVGYVLCGYTDGDKDGFFGKKEMREFVGFARGMQPWVAKIGTA